MINYRKNPTKWVIFTTKMIQKWVPFANSFQAIKFRKMNGNFVSLWSDLIPIFGDLNQSKNLSEIKPPLQVIKFKKCKSLDRLFISNCFELPSDWFSQ